MVSRLTVQTGTLLLLTHILTPSDFSLFAALSSLALLMGTLSTFGTHTTLLRDISQRKGKIDESLSLSLGTTRAASLLLFILYVAISNILFSSSKNIFIISFCIGLSEIIFQPFLLLSSIERQARGKVATAQFFIILPLLFRVVAALLLWTSKHQSTLLLFSVACLLATLVALYASLYRLPQSWPPTRNWKAISRPEIRHYFYFALLGVTNRAPGEADKVLAAQLMPAFLAGNYAVASRILGAIVTPIGALLAAALPPLFRYHSRRKGHKIQLWVLFTSLLYSLISGAIVFLLLPHLKSIFGQQYEQVFHFITLLIFIIPGRSLRMTGCNTLLTKGDSKKLIFVEVSGFLVMGVTALAITPFNPYIGIPVSVAITEYSMAFFSWGWVFFMSKSKIENKN